MEELVAAIKRELQLLEVDSGAHKEEEASRNAVKTYSGSLSNLQQLCSKASSFQLERRGSDDHRQLLRGVIPHLLVGAAAHCGEHYWTSAKSRKSAKALLGQVAGLCQCASVIELLVGIESISSATSPYMQEPSIDETSQEELETESSDIRDSVIPQTSLAESVPQNTEKRDSDTDHEIVINRLFSSGKQDSRVPMSVVEERSHDVSTSGGIGCYREQGVLKDVLALLRGKLKRDEWKSHPTAKHALLWCLKQLKRPHVGDNLESFLPPLLMLLDDHETYHKVLGLSGIRHVINNTDGAVLRWYGRTDVIFEAMRPMLYGAEIPVINAVHPCLLLLLPVMVGPTPSTIDLPLKPTKVDEVFDLLLNSMEFESKFAIRKAYIKHVIGYIELLQTFVIRHLKRLLSVLFLYIEYPDYCGEETRVWALKTLALLIRHAWPRIQHHSESILKALLKLVADLCPSNDVIPHKTEVKVQLPLITRCMVLLCRCHPPLKEVYRGICQVCHHSALQQCLSDCLEIIDEE